MGSHVVLMVGMYLTRISVADRSEGPADHMTSTAARRSVRCGSLRFFMRGVHRFVATRSGALCPSEGPSSSGGFGGGQRFHRAGDAGDEIGVVGGAGEFQRAFEHRPAAGRAIAEGTA